MSQDIDDLQDALEDRLGKAQRLSSDAGSREAHPIQDELALIRYAAGRRARAAEHSFFGIGVRKIVNGDSG